MKRLLALLLTLAMALSLAACGGESAPDTEDGGGASTSTAENEETTPEETPTAGETEEAPDTIQVTIPASFLSDPGETEASGIESAAFMGGILDGYYQEYTENEDGSITLTMTAEQHQEALSVLSSTLLETMADSFPDEENYPSVKGLDVSNDLKSITLTVDYEAYEASFDAFILYVAFYACEAYHALEGDDAAPLSVAVSIVDEATGETVETSVYPDDYDGLLEEETDAGIGSAGGFNSDLVTYTAEEAPDGLLFTLSNGNEMDAAGEIAVILYDDNGNMVGESTVYFESLPAGATGQFECQFDNPIEYTSYEASLSAEQAFVTNQNDSITIEDSPSEDGVVVKVTNNGEDDVSEVNMACLFYDEEGALVHIGATLVYELEAGKFATETFSRPYNYNSGEDILYDHYQVILTEAYSYPW